jgi:two-component system cell cycle sensor histidine kinase/response regulator CckA
VGKGLAETAAPGDGLHRSKPIEPRRPTWWGYGVAVVAILGAMAARAVAEPVIGARDLSVTFCIFMLPVAVAAAYAGLGPALSAVVLGAFTSRFFFLTPRHSLAVADPAAAEALAAYALTGVCLALLFEAQRRSHLRPHRTEHDVIVQASGLDRTAETALAEESQEERYRTPFEQAKDYAIFILDRDGRIAGWNRGVQRMFGYDSAEFLRAEVGDLYTPEDRRSRVPERELAEAVEHGRATGERWLVRKDGTRFWASVSTACARDPQGRLLGFAKRLRDLSEVKHVEDELHQSQEALQLAHEAAGLGTWDQDLVTGELRWDSRAKALFGLSPQAPVSRELWAAAVHPDDLARTQAQLDGAIKDRAPFSTEYCVVWPDGSSHWIAMIGRATFDPATGTPLRMAGVMLDVTERKRSEERLQEVARLEAVGRLAGGIAHDLNNMLVAILGFSDLLARGMQANDPKRIDVDQIAQAASRCATLTRQLLAFARRELIQPRLIDLNDAVRHAEGMLRTVLAENIELTTQLSPTIGTAFADPSQLEQILMNLVLNARDAMPQGGRVTIETTSVVIGAGSEGEQVAAELQSPQRCVMLAVSDTGHGMDPATLKRMWEPFFTTKPVGQGTGLGLAAVYGAMKQSGGLVRAESEPGRGTVVRLYWPEMQSPSEPPREKRKPAVQPGTETVLVVEDEPLVRALMVRALTSVGYRCFEAQDAERALRLVEEEQVQPALVLTDVVLPGQSGGWLGERLAVARPGLPVLYISGFADEDVVRRGLLDPERPFLQKPFAPHELARKVREVLDAAAQGNRQAQTA